MPFLSFDEVVARELVPGFHGQFVHTEQMTLAHWQIEAGAQLPPHDHPHEQITYVLEGRFEMTLDGETRVLEPGAVAVIPGGVPHGGRALTACRIVDAFHPAREDYR